MEQQSICLLYTSGLSVLARTVDARATRDIDLLAQETELGAAVEELRRLASVDLGDFMAFRFDKAEPIKSDDEYRSRLSSPWRGWPASPCAVRTMPGASRGTSPRETWPSSTPKSPRPLQAAEGAPRSGSGQEDDHGEPRPCRLSGRGLG